MDGWCIQDGARKANIDRKRREGGGHIYQSVRVRVRRRDAHKRERKKGKEDENELRWRSDVDVFWDFPLIFNK